MSDTGKTLQCEGLGALGYHPGLEGVIAGETALCQIDEGAGLRYRGYPIQDLAAQASFEEVAYLLLYGTLPTKNKLRDFCEALAAEAALPAPVAAFLSLAPPTAHPMDLLRTSVSLLGMCDPEAADNSHAANLRKSVRLLAQIPMIVAQAGSVQMPRQHSDFGLASDLGFAGHLLFLLTGRQGDSVAQAMAQVLNVSLILYAEHEFNTSTFAARVTASTLTDLHAAITAAIGALKGPLHGGANEAVAAMLLEVRSPDRAARWVREALASRQRVMGFGHRVLKTGDSRSFIIQRHAEALSRTCGDLRWYEIAARIEQTMRQEKSLFPNLDFYTAVAYLLMGIPRHLYTPLFVCSRVVGWCAHVIEQQDHNRLIRPRSLYTGPQPRAYVPIDQRA